VTIRLIRILKNANKNASQLTLNVRSKRSLFTAVIYWNLLRLMLSFAFHFIGIFNVLGMMDDVSSITSSSIIYISLSYVITIDAEIVHAIEGKGQQNESSTKTIKSIDDHISSTLSSSDQTYSQIIDDDKIIVVSMKRLSFFELANTVISDENDENDKNDENTNDNDRKNNLVLTH
jgi:hypothetical protein